MAFMLLVLESGLASNRVAQANQDSHAFRIDGRAGREAGSKKRPDRRIQKAVANCCPKSIWAKTGQEAALRTATITR
jgi:hypothetical protein